MTSNFTPILQPSYAWTGQQGVVYTLKLLLRWPTTISSLKNNFAWAIRTVNTEGTVGGAANPPVFDRSFNTIVHLKQGSDYAHHVITSPPPGLSDLTTALAIQTKVCRSFLWLICSVFTPLTTFFAFSPNHYKRVFFLYQKCKKWWRTIKKYSWQQEFIIQSLCNLCGNSLHF